MSDNEKIASGASLSLYDDLVKDRPENILRRLNALDKVNADIFEVAIGPAKLETLSNKVTTNNISASIESIPEENMTKADWLDLRASDF